MVHRRAHPFQRRQRVPAQAVQQRRRAKGIRVGVQFDGAHRVGRAAGPVQLRPRPRCVQPAARGALDHSPGRLRDAFAVGDLQRGGPPHLQYSPRGDGHPAVFAVEALPRPRHLVLADRPPQRVALLRRGTARRLPGLSGQLHGNVRAPGPAQRQRVGHPHVRLQRDPSVRAAHAHPHAHVVRALGVHQLRLGHPGTVAPCEAAAVEHLPERADVRRRVIRPTFRQRVQCPPVGRHGDGNVLGPLEPPLDFQAANPRVPQPREVMDAAQVPRGQQVSRLIVQPPGQAAGLGAEAAVAAPAPHHRGHQALARAGHAQRAVDERLDLDALRGARRQLVKGQLPRHHHAVKALVPQKRDGLPVVGGQLGAGVQLDVRRDLSQGPGHAQVLHDHGVRARAVHRPGGIQQRRALVLAHQRVQRHVDLHAPGVAVGHGLVQRRTVEVARVAPRVERARAQVHGVRAVLHRRPQGARVPRRGQQLDGPATHRRPRSPRARRRRGAARPARP